DAGRAVGAGGDGAAAVGAERGAEDGGGVAQGGEAGLAGGRVEDPGGVVVAGGQDPAAVGAERHVGDALVVEPELAQAGALAQDGGDAGAVRQAAGTVVLQLQG